MRVGFLFTRLRAEEKYLLEELHRRPNVEVVMINDDEVFYEIAELPAAVDVLFERSVSYSRGAVHQPHLCRARRAGSQPAAGCRALR